MRSKISKYVRGIVTLSSYTIFTDSFVISPKSIFGEFSTVPAKWRYRSRVAFSIHLGWFDISKDEVSFSSSSFLLSSSLPLLQVLETRKTCHVSKGEIGGLERKPEEVSCGSDSWLLHWRERNTRTKMEICICMYIKKGKKERGKRERRRNKIYKRTHTRIVSALCANVITPAQ